MEKKGSALRLIAGLLWAVILFVSSQNELLAAQDSSKATETGWESCNEFLVPQKRVNGKLIGQENCQMQQTGFTYLGQRFQRIDVRVSGTVSGASATTVQVPESYSESREGRRAEYFNSAPDFVFAQYGQKEWSYYIARYEGAAGVGVNLFYPESGAQWNGKLFFVVTGTGLCSRGGGGDNADRSDPLRDVSKYDKLMLEKGYAVAITTRAVAPPAGETPCSIVTLDNGATLINMNFTDHPDIHLEFVKLAENLLVSQLGREPSRKYFYGKSSGARVGRLINYKPGLNIDEAGKQIFNGFLLDDAGSGLWLPILIRDGKDVLFTTDKERERFVKQIEITHQLYVNWKKHSLPGWISKVYLINKRNNAKLLREKGLGAKHRMYEVKGVSHSGGEFSSSRAAGDIKVLDLSKTMDAMIDLLDNWVDQGTEPPPTKSDWLELGDIDGDGINENPAVALPEVACPLGVYYPYPASLGEGGVGTTAFAAFDGKSLEPLDGRGVFVDMNLNQYPDNRETVTQAWRRLGLLKSDVKFSQETYVDCFRATVAKLRQENFITEERAALYLEEAAQVELPTQ